MAKVAFIGLGVMGYPMAGHLKARGGHDVTVYNRTAAKAEQWAAAFGGRTAATPAEAAKDQDFVFACVGNDDDLRSVTTGENGAFETMAPGSVFIDNTTASAAVARELYAAAAAKGRISSTRRSPADRPERKTACSPSCAGAMGEPSTRPSPSSKPMPGWSV